MDQESIQIPKQEALKQIADVLSVSIDDLMK